MTYIAQRALKLSIFLRETVVSAWERSSSPGLLSVHISECCKVPPVRPKPAGVGSNPRSQDAPGDWELPVHKADTQDAFRTPKTSRRGEFDQLGREKAGQVRGKPGFQSFVARF